MNNLFTVLLVLIFAAAGFSQSGRTKPSPTPTPRTIMGPSVTTSQRPVPVHLPPSPSATPADKEDPDVIRVEAALVPIPVSVTDARGRSISTLKITDFELLIDGSKAEISEFSHAQTPIRMAMLFDNSSSVIVAREFEKQAAIRFFQRVIRPDRDLAALFSVADFTRLEHPFTSNVQQLTSAIENFPAPKGATALLDGVIEAATYLRSANGRRVIVIVSDGEDTYSDLKTTLEEVVRTLLVNDCQVYVVKTKDYENFKRTGVRVGNANIRSLTAEHRMIEITRQTGGAVFSPIDDRELSAAFAQIVAELSQQYVLSYYPEGDEKRGEFRSIELQIKDKPDLSIRARKGYYVPKR